MSGSVDRDRRIEQFRKGSLPVLVATQLADEGLDVPELDLLVQTIPGKASRGVIQRAGRTMRPSGARVPLIVEWVDGGPHERQAFKRVGIYRWAIGVTPEWSTVEDVIGLLNDSVYGSGRCLVSGG
jgi:superfamily II DNA or RNA helicase